MGGWRQRALVGREQARLPESETGMGRRRLVTVLTLLAACGGVAPVAPAAQGPVPPSTSILRLSTTAVPSTAVPSTAVPATAVPSPTVTVGPPTTTPPAATPSLPPAELTGLGLEPVATGLSQPTVVVTAPGGADLIVAERGGRIVRLPARGGEAEPYLDLTVASGGIEQGLLGLAFHPAGKRLFVYYVSAEGNRTLTRLRVEGGRAVPASAEVLFSLPQPAGSVDIRHYGGHLAFGPDGYLYVSLGDGADALGQGQDPGTVFGALLRLDVDGDGPYAIPADNPFVDGGGAPEVWAYGLRNPWRFSIDPVDEMLYVADVGQETWEEVNVIPLAHAGANLGWPSLEGRHCFLDSDCDPGAYLAPVLEYGHDDGCSITGGHVYRGEAIPEMAGHYFFSDWCGGWLRSFRLVAGAATAVTDWDVEGAGQVTAFGLDHQGELLLANFAGEIYRIVPRR